MILTTEQHNILAHIVVDPQKWADHAEATHGHDAVLQKVEKYREAYQQALQLEGINYKTRAQRETSSISSEELAKGQARNQARQALKNHKQTYPTPNTLAVLAERVRLIEDALDL